MMGVFVQLNEDSQQRRGRPLGYVIEENGCWSWVGHRTINGYALWCTRYVHRMMYERHKGPTEA